MLVLKTIIKDIRQNTYDMIAAFRQRKIVHKRNIHSMKNNYIILML